MKGVTRTMPILPRHPAQPSLGDDAAARREGPLPSLRQNVRLCALATVKKWLSFSRPPHHLIHQTLSEPKLDWIVIHWFELSTLVLLCLNLWFVSAVLSTLRETNRWLSFLSRVQWDEVNSQIIPNNPRS